MPYIDKEKQKEYQRTWMSKRRQEWLDANGPCQICNSTENLEVDHIDPSTKSYEPTEIWSRKETVRLLELAKCQVLCKDCHKEKTRKQLTIVEHGRRNTYMKHGCRCDLCVTAAKLHRQRYRMK